MEYRHCGRDCLTSASLTAMHYLKFIFNLQAALRAPYLYGRLECSGSLVACSAARVHTRRCLSLRILLYSVTTYRRAQRHCSINRTERTFSTILTLDAKEIKQLAGSFKRTK